MNICIYKNICHNGLLCPYNNINIWIIKYVYDDYKDSYSDYSSNNNSVDELYQPNIQCFYNMEG